MSPANDIKPYCWLATLVTAVTPGAVWLSGGLLFLDFVAFSYSEKSQSLDTSSGLSIAGIVLITAAQVMDHYIRLGS